jgi:acyl-CoA thioesterase
MTARFIDHVGLQFDEQGPGRSRCTIDIEPHHMNTFDVVHGGVLFTLADTGMGAALVPMLAEGERCATIEAKINYFRSTRAGRLECRCEVVHKGKTVAHVEARVMAGDQLVATAHGSFSILPPGRSG